MKKIKRIIQEILAIKFVRSIVTTWNRYFLSLVSSNRLFATIYSLINPITFNREQYALLRGRAQYYRNLSKVQSSNVRLRRNTHRLEKGLSMEPRRNSFALEYIDETIESYESIIAALLSNHVTIDECELLWATDVLEAYFSAVQLTPRLKQLQTRFKNAKKIANLKKSATTRAPFQRKKSPPNRVDYNDLLQLSLRRRSVRWFEDRSVPRELIDKALMVARQSPSACNRQPFEYRFYDDPKLVRNISSLPFGAGGYSHNIPVICVVVGKQENYFSSRDRHVIYIDSSLSIMAFMFALETLGLASCPINWPDFEPLEIKMQNTLGLQAYERPIMLIAVGYPREDGVIPFSEKKPLHTIRSFNKIT
ncbi:MAG: nitroreductase family protein [Bdellovibrionales bacterium]|nr:nitroreductase family protein [Bdellovibrionales bacterium]